MRACTACDYFFTSSLNRHVGVMHSLTSAASSEDLVRLRLVQEGISKLVFTALKVKMRTCPHRCHAERPQRRKEVRQINHMGQSLLQLVKRIQIRLEIGFFDVFCAGIQQARQHTTSIIQDKKKSSSIALGVQVLAAQDLLNEAVGGILIHSR
eukprot:scaffold9446_cov72-Skeletonema_dohrnii-CCMP3373.AAC.4